MEFDPAERWPVMWHLFTAEQKAKWRAVVSGPGLWRIRPIYRLGDPGTIERNRRPK